MSELGKCGVCGSVVKYVPYFNDEGLRTGDMRPVHTLSPEVQAVLDAAIECYNNKSDKLVKWNKVSNAVKALKDKESSHEPGNL